MQSPIKTPEHQAKAWRGARAVSISAGKSTKPDVRKKPTDRKLDDALTEALEESFPASDPISSLRIV